MPEQNEAMPQNLPVAPQEAMPFSISLRKDMTLAAIIGFLCALLILPIFKNLMPDKPFSYALSLLLILPVLCVLGIWIARVIGKKVRMIYQLAKFVLVGALNTFVDWGVLNLEIFLTGFASGGYYTGFKGISFAVATINSYFWNKFWTFKKTEDEGKPEATPKEFLRFFLVSLVGFALNVGVAHILVNILGPQFGLNVITWATVGALGGTLVGLVWNFLGYKLIVFKS
jgi:putative flippase GtrA